jgi:hypothetical protein
MVFFYLRADAKISDRGEAITVDGAVILTAGLQGSGDCWNATELVRRGFYRSSNTQVNGCKKGISRRFARMNADQNEKRVDILS